jgi:hypothetical protein
MNGVLRLQLAEEGADAERLDVLTGFLRRELLQLDVDDVTALPAGEPPPGVRGLDAVTVGSLLVALGNATEGMGAVITAIRAWLTRGGRAHRSVRLEIDGNALELSNATDTDQDRLIALFIARHATGVQER